MPKLAGIARISANSELLESLPGAELDLGGTERELKSGHRVYGSTEKIIPSTLTATIVWKNGTPIEDMRNFVDGVIIFEADIGESYSMENATITKTVKVKDESGEVTLEFGGDPAKKL